MKIKVPRHDAYQAVKFVVKTAAGVIKAMADSSHSVIDVALPAGIAEEAVDVIAHFCDTSGAAVGEPVVIQQAKVAIQAAKRAVHSARETVEAVEETVEAAKDLGATLNRPK